MMKRKQDAGHIILSFVFILYLTGILSITGVCIRGSFSPLIVLIPFRDMISGPLETVLNILLFVPLGIFLPVLYKEFCSPERTASAAFYDLAVS